MAVPDISSGSMPTSLYTSYQKYKASTTTIVDWLVSCGTSTSGKQRQTARISVRKLLELAQDIAQRSIKPPVGIHEAFKVALVNRRKLTAYYDALKAPSESISQATNGHKYFNETPAQAYDALFPNPKTPRHANFSKKPAKVAQAANTTKHSANRFDVVSSIVEPEVDSGTNDYLSSTVEDEKAANKMSKLEDDPMESVIALHAYVNEIERVINLVNET